MDISQMKIMSFNEIRVLYKSFLQRQSFSKNTIGTAYSDTFYLWKHGSSELFWDMVTAADFPESAKEKLIETLSKDSTGDAKKLANGYVSHMKRFRAFLNDDSVSAPAPALKVTNKMVSSRKCKLSIEVPIPSIDEVEKYLAKWNSLENYRLQESALNKLFFELCPNNVDISDILLKASTLNDFYSTNIFSIYPVAKHICLLKIDDRLKAGDVTLVDDIKKVAISDTEKNFFSFSTKYCSHHNPVDYPIYDSYVDEVLCYFRNRDGFALFKNDELRNYVRFKGLLIDFRAFYGLDKYSLKQIDQYVWQLGKEYFPKDYGKKKKKKSAKESQNG